MLVLHLLHVHRRPDRPRSEARAHLPICEQLPRCAQSLKGCLTLCFFCFLDLWLFNPCRRFFLDCAPHVRPIPRSSDPTELGAHSHCQHRYLGKEEGYYSDSNRRLGDQRSISRSG